MNISIEIWAQEISCPSLVKGLDCVDLPAEACVFQGQDKLTQRYAVQTVGVLAAEHLNQHNQFEPFHQTWFP